MKPRITKAKVKREGVRAVTVREAMTCDGCGLQVPVAKAADHAEVCDTVYFSEVVRRSGGRTDA